MAPFFEDNTPSAYNSFELFGRWQIVAWSEIFDVSTLIYSYKLAVSKICHKQLIFDKNNNYRSASFFKVFYNLSLYFFKH